MIEKVNRWQSANLAEADKAALEKLKMPNTVVVTSGSAIKINTVTKAMKLLFPNRNLVVKGVKAEAGINEQPVDEQTAQGARNRIANAKTQFVPQNPGVEAVYLSIENGIFKVGNEWDDRAVVVIEFPNSVDFQNESEGVRFPNEAVEEARRREGGFGKHTVGSVIAEQFAARGVVVDKQDPHTALTQGKFTREEQMIEAITGAFLKAAKAA